MVFACLLWAGSGHCLSALVTTLKEADLFHKTGSQFNTKITYFLVELGFTLGSSLR